MYFKKISLFKSNNNSALQITIRTAQFNRGNKFNLVPFNFIIQLLLVQNCAALEIGEHFCKNAITLRYALLLVTFFTYPTFNLSYVLFDLFVSGIDLITIGLLEESFVKITWSMKSSSGKQRGRAEFLKKLFFTYLHQRDGSRCYVFR